MTARDWLWLYQDMVRYRALLFVQNGNQPILMPDAVYHWTDDEPSVSGLR